MPHLRLRQTCSVLLRVLVASALLGTTPTLLAMTANVFHVASYGNGVGGSQVYRVDRSTGRKVAQRTAATSVTA